MPIKKRTFTDGISILDQTVIDWTSEPIDDDDRRALADESARLKNMTGSAFEFAIHDVEHRWLAEPEGTPRDRADPLNPAAFRLDILSGIARLRNVLAAETDPRRREQIETWVMMAMRLSRRIEEAAWRLGRGRTHKIGINTQAKNQQNAMRAAGQQKRRRGSRDGDIRRHHAEYRARHPHHSIRAMAAAIGRTLDIPTETVRDRLKRMHLV